MMRAIPTSERANSALAAPSNDTAEQTQFVRMLKRECKPDQGRPIPTHRDEHHQGMRERLICFTFDHSQRMLRYSVL